MPTVVTNNFKLQEGGKNISLSADSWICSLMNEHVNSASSEVLKDSINWYGPTSPISAYEVTGTGYTSGLALTNVGWFTDDTNNIQKLSASSVVFTAPISVVTYGCCIWRLTDGLIIGFVDFGLQTSSNGSFTINWNVDGILNKS